MKKHYLKTGNKKVMSAVLLAAAMMVGLTACGGSKNEESKQPENSVVESTVESSVEESTEESAESVEDILENEGTEMEDGEVETRTYTIEIDGVETELEETLFRSENGFNIWYPAELLEAAEIDGYDGFLQLDAEGEAEVSFMIVPVDATLYLDEMLLEASNEYVESDQYEAVTVGGIVTFEAEEAEEAEMVVKSIEVVHDDTTDRFYAVSDGENAVLITVKASAETMEVMGAYFDRMADTVEFTGNEIAEMEDDAVLQSENAESAEDEVVDGEATESETAESEVAAK